MKYKNVVIICKKEKIEELQKYLFRLKYHWIDNDNKNRHVKTFNRDICIVIANDTSMHARYFLPNLSYPDFTYLTYPNFVRKEKLERLNKNVL